MGINTRYYDDDDSSYAADGGSGCLMFFRALLMGVNVLLAASAIGALAVGLIDSSKMETTLSNLCPQCHIMLTLYTIFFSAVLFFSLLGFLALCTRNVCLRALYFLSLLIVFLVALGISVAYSLVTTDHIDMQNGWEMATQNDARGLCLLELQLQCSGWVKLCDMPNQTRQMTPLSYGISPDHVQGLLNPTNNASHACPVCDESEQEQIMKYDQTCKDAVMNFLKSRTRMALPTGFSVAGVALIGMIVTCMLHRRTERDQRYGGRYYRM